MKSFLRSIIDPIIDALRTLVQPQRWFALPGKLLNLSLPGAVATILALFLLIVAATFAVLVVRKGGPANSWEKYKEYLFYGGLLAPLAVAMTYYAVKLWVEGETSPFVDIDRAWRAGIEALEKNRLDIRQIPLFLVAGTSSDEHEKNLFTAARQSFTVHNVPPGPAPLHWYAHQDAIYLVLSQVGCISSLAREAIKLPVDAPGINAAVTAIGPSIRMTAFPTSPAAAAETPGGGGSGSSLDIRGTMMATSPDLRATVDLTTVAPGPRARSIELRRDEIEHQDKRLAYLCRLLTRARRPVCPVNGTLLVFPLALMAADNTRGSTIKEAARTDVQSLLAGLRLRFPVVALVTGLEEEEGFAELVRRVGRDRASSQRFGKGFGVWDPPIDEQLEALGKHACGAFEDWAYHLFREKDALSKPGNRHLYSLVCRVRRTLEPKMNCILPEGFGFDREKEDDAPLLPLFGGCYFAATGGHPDRQAFVKGVFDRLPEQQAELEWTDAALREDGWYRALSWVGFILAVAAIAALFWQWQPIKLGSSTNQNR